MFLTLKVIELSTIGKIVDKEIQKLNFIISINADENGRTQFAPTVSRIVKQFKGSITKQIGKTIWQKSFYDHAVRNQRDYNGICEYI